MRLDKIDREREDAHPSAGFEPAEVFDLLEHLIVIPKM